MLLRFLFPSAITKNINIASTRRELHIHLGVTTVCMDLDVTTVCMDLGVTTVCMEMIRWSAEEHLLKDFEEVQHGEGRGT